MPPAIPQEIVEDGLRRYFAARRLRVDPFINRHFSVRGALRIHRAALGWDILRAPANLSLAGPNAAVHAAAAAARRFGAPRLAASLARRHVLLDTRVAREMRWLVMTELLELPARDGARESRRDALAEVLLADPRVEARVQETLAAVAGRAGEPEFRQRLQDAMGEYAATRAAASEITTALLSLSAGALALNKLTPGMVSLGPTLAAILAQQAAVASFPLGAGLGSVWYGLFPVAPPVALVAGLTGGMMLSASVFAAFAGIIADPVQRRLGLHRRRLLKLIDNLERQAFDPAAPAFALRDHYVARVVDLFDLLGAAWRLAR
ncbi:MAG TPA: DUF6635 family protein [Acetobacteraceae bacterium]|nr:DUF6635 family protein [Acetobacteraceae bacterium]